VVGVVAPPPPPLMPAEGVDAPAAPLPPEVVVVDVKFVALLCASPSIPPLLLLLGGVLFFLLGDVTPRSGISDTLKKSAATPSTEGELSIPLRYRSKGGAVGGLLWVPPACAREVW
jgi:hypothetical protein